MRLRMYDAEGQLWADSFELAEPSFEFGDPGSGAVGPGFRPRPRSCGRLPGRRARTARLCRTCRAGRRRLAGAGPRARAGPDPDRAAPRARPDPGDHRRCARRPQWRHAADHAQRRRHHPGRARRAHLAADHHRAGAGGLGRAVAVPRAHHHRAAAPSRQCGGARAPGPRPRGRSAAHAASVETRSACSPARSRT